MAMCSMAVVGTARSSKRTSRGPYSTVPRTMYLLPDDRVRHRIASYWIRKRHQVQRIARRQSLRTLDPRGEVADLAHNRIHTAVELTDPHDAGEVADVVVVEDEVT